MAGLGTKELEEQIYGIRRQLQQDKEKRMLHSKRHAVPPNPLHWARTGRYRLFLGTQWELIIQEEWRRKEDLGGEWQYKWNTPEGSPVELVNRPFTLPPIP